MHNPVSLPQWLYRNHKMGLKAIDLFPAVSTHQQAATSHGSSIHLLYGYDRPFFVNWSDLKSSDHHHSLQTKSHQLILCYMKKFFHFFLNLPSIHFLFLTSMSIELSGFHFLRTAALFCTYISLILSLLVQDG